MKVYVAGPMRGYDKYNFPAFDRAAERLRNSGIEVVNPADLDRAVGVDENTDPLPPDFMASAMRRDLSAIAGDCQGIILLPGWEHSSGVATELVVAEACGLRVYYFSEDPYPYRWGLPTTYEEVKERKEKARELVGSFNAGPDRPSWSFVQRPELRRLLEEDDLKRRTTDEATWADSIERDNGTVRTFDTGATRDSADGKYDFEGFLSPRVLFAFADYMLKHQYQSDGSLRPSDNWQKGIPKDAYMKSMFRHFMDLWALHRGLAPIRPETDEEVDFDDSLAGLLFNVMGYLHEHLKEQQYMEAA